MNIEINLNDSEVKKLTIELLINIAAKQESLAYLMIKLLAVDKDEENKLIESFQNDSSIRRDDLINHLYEKMGSVSLTDILGEKA